MTMKNFTLRIVFAVLLVQLMTGSAEAGRGDKAGTSAAPELLIPVGARGIAMGSSLISSVSGIDAIFWNPAGLARTTRGANATFSHMNHLTDIGIDYGAVSIGSPTLGVIGLSLKSIAFGDIPITTEDQPDGTGEIASTTFITLGATYSRQLADRISVGVTMNYIAERMERVSASGVAFNIGVQYSDVGSIPGLSLGVVVKNFGPAMSYEGSGLLRTGNVDDVNRSGSFYELRAADSELPSTMEMGVGYSIKVDNEGSLNIVTSFQNNNFSDDEYKIGGEYAYSEMFFVRAGYASTSQTIPSADNTRNYIYGPTFGAGVRTVVDDIDIAINYAFLSTLYFSGNHVIEISAGF